MDAAIDHLLYGCPDLALGIEEIERLTGVRPLYGGEHPGRGTRNALLSLGGRTYLEVIAPDPAQGVDPAALPYGIGTLRAPSLRAWAAAPEDIDAAAAAGRAAGIDLGQVEERSRATPDGGSLRWRMAKRTATTPAIAAVPFLIDWGLSTHPAQVAPRGSDLVALRISVPEPELVERQLRAVGLGVGGAVSVVTGAEPALEAVLRSPSGTQVVLST